MNKREKKSIPPKKITPEKLLASTQKKMEKLKLKKQLDLEKLNLKKQSDLEKYQAKKELDYQKKVEKLNNKIDISSKNLSNLEQMLK